jgi:hypothetical protein
LAAFAAWSAGNGGRESVLIRNTAASEPGATTVQSRTI